MDPSGSHLLITGFISLILHYMISAALRIWKTRLFLGMPALLEISLQTIPCPEAKSAKRSQALIPKTSRATVDREQLVNAGTIRRVRADPSGCGCERMPFFIYLLWGGKFGSRQSQNLLVHTSTHRNFDLQARRRSSSGACK